MAPRLNIIYVRGTVRLLLPYLATLIEHSDWDFTLIANGCTREETLLLEDVRLRHGDRIHVRVESVDVVLDHGHVLDQLLLEETGEYFCFLDSDVLAIGPTTVAEMLPAEHEAATCSCLPIWYDESDSTMPEGFQILSGRFLETADGRPLGCTYAAVYRTEELRERLDRWQVSMRRYRWSELPAVAKEALTRSGFRRRVYDTAKLANIAVQSDGRPMVYRDIPALLHLGSQSELASIDVTMKMRIRKLLWLRMPSLYGALWRARGLSVAESRGLAAHARRRRDVMLLVDRLTARAVPPSERPEWLTEEAMEAFMDVTAPAGEDRLSVTSG